MLLAGLGGLGAEVAKNLILAGVKGLTLLDHEQVSTRQAQLRSLSSSLSLIRDVIERAAGILLHIYQTKHIYSNPIKQWNSGRSYVRALDLQY